MTKTLTIMFYDPDRGWVTDTLDVEEEPDERDVPDETVRDQQTYYV